MISHSARHQREVQSLLLHVLSAVLVEQLALLLLLLEKGLLSQLLALQLE